MYFEKMQKKKSERERFVEISTKKIRSVKQSIFILWWCENDLDESWLMDFWITKLIDRFNQNECWDKLVQYSKRGKLYVLSHDFVLFIMLPVHVQCNSS